MSEQEQQAASEGSIGQSASTAELGAAVLVDGVVVAWFADFNESAQEWCTENHFGRWLTWQAKPPEIVPLTEAEYDEVMRQGEELAAELKSMSETPNVQGQGDGQA